VARDLKTIYNAATEDEARENLEAFSEKPNVKYPHISKSWEKKPG